MNPLIWINCKRTQSILLFLRKTQMQLTIKGSLQRQKEGNKKVHLEEFKVPRKGLNEGLIFEIIIKSFEC